MWPLEVPVSRIWEFISGIFKNNSTSKMNNYKNLPSPSGAPPHGAGIAHIAAEIKLP
jgi:hypothetical protein